MSYLTDLGTRIKATEVTKKTTNAMRLIAMSTHSRLRQAKAALELYKSTIENTVNEIRSEIASSVKQESAPGKELYVIVGSQKGLCGNYNANLTMYFHLQLEHRSKDNDLLIIGKQMRERLFFQGIKSTFSQDEFSLSKIGSITQLLAGYVLSSEYESVTIFYTRPKTFFLQAHEAVNLSKGMFQFRSTGLDGHAGNFEISEQSYTETVNFLGFLSLKSYIQAILTDSLIAEASSRFLSMDVATRNAEDLIGHMKLDYNKLRQTAITRELTDLAGIYTLEN